MEMSSILTSLKKEVRMEGHLVMSAKERRRKVEFVGMRPGLGAGYMADSPYLYAG